MEPWRIALSVVLGWCFIGAVAALVVQHSFGLRRKIISAGRGARQRAVERLAKYIGIREQEAERVMFRDSDDFHLAVAYTLLIALGIFAWYFVWAFTRRPDRGNQPGRG
jgi:hypothetical protein